MATLKSIIYSTAYADDMVKRDKCKDPDIINDVCKNTCKKSDLDCNDCKNNIKYIENNQNQIWTRVFNYTSDDCTTDSDCTKGLKCIKNPSDPIGSKNLSCGFDTINDYAGNCGITSEITCKNLSIPKYNCDKNAKSIEECTKTKDNRYAEWHYNNPSDQSKGGKCILGNFYSKQWAENPQTRSLATKQGGIPPPFFYDDQNSNVYITPEYCYYFQGATTMYGTGSKNTADNDDNSCKGGNWVRSSDCDLIGGNCRHVCVSNDTSAPYYGAIKCTTDADCPKSTYKSDVNTNSGIYMEQTKCMNIDNGKTSDKICIGDSSDCTTSTLKDIATNLVGNTLFNMFVQPPATRDCEANTVKDVLHIKDTKEKFEPKLLENDIKDFFSKFNNISDNVSKLADSKYMKNKKVLTKDIAGSGINLYLIEWNVNTVNFGIKDKSDIGFDYDEVIKLYPEICKIVDKIKFISINKDQIKNNKDIKKIYVYIGSNNWLKSILLK